MKKTMFITSVIMVVVMAIALTTSSLAWFTSQGGNTATTTALTITAATEASGGIQISASSPTTTNPLPNYFVWDITASLATGNAVGSMMPLVPNANAETPAGSDLLTALSNESSGVAAPSMVGNYIGSNGKFEMDRASDQVAEPTDKKYTTGYFVKDVWVTNIASGAAAKAVTIAPTIAFTDGTNAYTHSSGNAVLWVAVLGRTTSTDASDGTDASGAWEIVALNASNSASSVAVAYNDGLFDAGDSVDGATVGIPTSNAAWIKGTSTGTIAAITGDGEKDVRHYRVVAWYDGASLYNNNSTISIPFVVTFTATDYTPTNSNNGD